jgi:RNA polymerase sigma factor (sigma-70 family)
MARGELSSRADDVRVQRRDADTHRLIRTLYNLGTTREMTDGQLLERFATASSEVAELAFAALVERHQAMVWRVCRAIVRDEHAAEDAFQSTFLVLVRRARSLWVQDSLGPWLHQVACRTASCLRSVNSRRHKHEQRFAERLAGRMVEVSTACEPDLEASIQDEVNRLPEKYRSPIVLCDLEGRTHREAARSLGWPIGTVKSRQAQGRQLLRTRLIGRGFGLAVAAAVLETLSRTASAAVPRSVARSTVSAGMRWSARVSTGFGVSAAVLTLTQGVIHMMLWSKVRFFVACLAVMAAGGGAAVYVRGSQEPAPPIGRTDSSGKAKAPDKSPPVTAQIRLRAQQLATRKAKAQLGIARLNRELAELALEEYEQVVYPRDLAAVEGEIQLAESDVKRSEDRLDWARRMFDKGYVSERQKTSEEWSLKTARFSLEQTQSKREVLTKYSKDKTIKQLRVEIEKARSDEQTRQAMLEIEEIKELEIQELVRRNSR